MPNFNWASNNFKFCIVTMEITRKSIYLVLQMRRHNYIMIKTDYCLVIKHQNSFLFSWPKCPKQIIDVFHGQNNLYSGILMRQIISLAWYSTAVRICSHVKIANCCSVEYQTMCAHWRQFLSISSTINLSVETGFTYMIAPTKL